MSKALAALQKFKVFPTMAKYMTDKVVLVAGGGTGIGFAIAKRFIDLDALVVITGRRESKLSDAVLELGHNASTSLETLLKAALRRELSNRFWRQRADWTYW